MTVPSASITPTVTCASTLAAYTVMKIASTTFCSEIKIGSSL